MPWTASNLFKKFCRIIVSIFPIKGILSTDASLSFSFPETYLLDRRKLKNPSRMNLTCTFFVRERIKALDTTSFFCQAMHPIFYENMVLFLEIACNRGTFHAS